MFILPWWCYIDHWGREVGSDVISCSCRGAMQFPMKTVHIQFGTMTQVLDKRGPVYTKHKLGIWQFQGPHTGGPRNLALHNSGTSRSGWCLWRWPLLASARSETILTHMLKQLVHTQLTHTHAHTTCPHTTCPRTTCPHTTCSHTTYSHTTTTHFVHTHTHAHLVLTQLPHTQLPHIRLHMQLVHTHRCLRSRRGTWRHRASLCVAGVALGDMDLHFAWQARHFWHWTGSGGALGLLGDIERRFAWQAWHLATPPLCVAGVARMALGWLWWRAWGGFGAVDAAGVFTPLCDTPCFTHYLSHTIFDTPSFIQLCHTPSFTHNFVTPSLSHTTLTHTTFHTPLCHTPSLTHDLSHTTLSHTIFHTQSLTHHLANNFVTHRLSHTIFDTPSFTPLRHTIFHTPSQTIFHTPLCHTPSLTHDLSHTALSHTIFHTQSLTHHLTHTIFHHTIFHTHNFVTNHFSSTSSFVFPSFPVPAAKFVDHYWKKLTCGVMRSLNFLLNSVLYAHHRHAAELHAPTGILYETIRCSSQVMDNAHVR